MYCVSGCTGKVLFSGSKIIGGDQIKVDFETLNTTVCGAMPLKTGERVNTFIAADKGIVDIQVNDATGVTVYRGNNMESCSFVIEIRNDGNYTFSVSGENAVGSVAFIKAAAPTGNQTTKP